MTARLTRRLRRFIRERAVLAIEYQHGIKIVEPYLVYATRAGSQVLHGWQRSGAWQHSPPPDWVNLSLDKIGSVEPTGKNFARPHSGYNPESSQFHRVLFLG